MIRRINRTIFFLIVFLIPLNLGKHFIFEWSYLNGLLVDYFVPTLYAQDILIGMLLVSSIFSWDFKRTLRFKQLLSSKIPLFVLVIVFSALLSVVVSSNVFASVYAFSRLLLYVLFFVYVLTHLENSDFTVLAKVLSASVFLVGILGILQWFNHGAVFNNYLWFGEQPYSFSTYGIVRENIFGKTYIPSYGTFPHPNVFGGFLAIALLWVFVLVPENKFSTVAFGIGVLALLTTVSYISILAFILGVLFVFLPRSTSVTIVLFILVFSLTLPFIKSENPSVYRRGELLLAHARLIKQNPLFGTGINTSPLYAYEPRFMQPVHNVFVLIFSETGAFAACSLVLLLGMFLFSMQGSKLLFVTLLQIIILGSFDHYFYTLHQTLLLFWLVLGVIGFHYIRDRVLPTQV